MTKSTAFPKPVAVLYSDETEIKEHMPRKFESTMLLVKIDARKITNGLIAGALPTLSTSSLLACDNVVNDPNHHPDQENAAGA